MEEQFRVILTEYFPEWKGIRNLFDAGAWDKVEEGLQAAVVPEVTTEQVFEQGMADPQSCNQIRLAFFRPAALKQLRILIRRLRNSVESPLGSGGYM